MVASSVTSLPTLWLDSPDGLDNLAKKFQLKQPSDTPTSGMHIIALQSERDIRRVARSIQQKERIVGVVPPEILYLRDTDGIKLFDAASRQRFEAWQETISQMPLEFEAAIDIIRDTLQSLQCGEITRDELNKEKEELRKRCGMNSSGERFDWNQRIKDLEAEIHAAVNKTEKVRRINLEIQSWLRITNETEQELERIRILTHYQLRDKSFERIVRGMRLAESESAHKSHPLSIGELFSLESEPLQWLAPGFMPAKTSVLLSGLPGSGKSLLALDLAFAICRGEKFLGEQCAKGKVLYIASDQPLNQTKQYLWERGFEDSDPLTIVGEGQGMSAWSVRKLEDLEGWLLLGGYTLVICDSIRSTICYPLGLEEKSEQVGHWMKEVERLVTRYGSLLWIHHDNKDKDLKGVSRASGSTAIPGNVSVHWRLETVNADPSNPNRRFSMPKTRGFEASTINIQFNPESGEWQSFGRAGENEAATASYQQQILTLLAQCPGVGMEGCEIRQAIGSDSVYTILGRLVAKGIISKRRSKTTKGKVYFLP